MVDRFLNGHLFGARGVCAALGRLVSSRCAETLELAKEPDDALEKQNVPFSFLEDVEHIATGRDACGPWHAGNLTSARVQ